MGILILGLFFWNSGFSKGNSSSQKLRFASKCIHAPQSCSCGAKCNWFGMGHGCPLFTLQQDSWRGLFCWFCSCCWWRESPFCLVFTETGWTRFQVSMAVNLGFIIGSCWFNWFSFFFFSITVMEICLLIIFFGGNVQNHLTMLLHVWWQSHWSRWPHALGTQF